MAHKLHKQVQILCHIFFSNNLGLSHFPLRQVFKLSILSHKMHDHNSSLCFTMQEHGSNLAEDFMFLQPHPILCKPWDWENRVNVLNCFCSMGVLCHLVVACEQRVLNISHFSTWRFSMSEPIRFFGKQVVCHEDGILFSGKLVWFYQAGT